MTEAEAEAELDRLAATVADFDAQNARDPRSLTVDGVARPQELVDAERLAVWIDRLAPDASVPLRLAAHCQHLRRWETPRTSYPDDRAGYLKWRAALLITHAELAAETLRAHGWDASTIDAVRCIVEKRRGPDTQHMEDALCLAFLEHEAEEFASKHDEDKVVRVLRKTWRKMSPAGKQAALELALSPPVAALVSRAVADGASADAT
ncbi:MAG: DUF4202 domain-containing protein [Deltaproteobacteria bacterium]|nr:DUF4202 domain-containing protein [Deltaproteobacteria bacterium]MDQ3295163.1 DUF4202 domain-containing protein [Myxococcota bacterium]